MRELDRPPLARTRQGRALVSSAETFSLRYEIPLMHKSFTAADTAALPQRKPVIGRALVSSAETFSLRYEIPLTHESFAAADTAAPLC